MARIGLLLTGLVIAAAICELSVRFYALLDQRFARDIDVLGAAEPMIEPYGTIGYRQRPGARFVYPNGKRATANAMGFRGPTVPLPKPPGRFRIVLLGGSSTHGWSVNDDETIDEVMRRLLLERDSGRKFDVVNLAFDGYDSYQDLERLRINGLPLEPDLVIVNSGINDVRNALFPDLQDPDPRTFL